MNKMLYQTDSYLTRVETTVARCVETDDGFESILSETILYPEGGGQPSDHGKINGLDLLRLYKNPEGEVVHLLEKPVSGAVEVELDWDRRYDHMQQHTGQHILTALASSYFGHSTTAFHLGEKRCDIELDCVELSQSVMAELEKKVNAAIMEGLPVSADFIEPNRMDQLGVRSRGLPEGFNGKVRIVDINGVDKNTCGGTHVANTKELQLVKLLRTERLRGGTRLFFVAGFRAINMMGRMIEREMQLNKALSCSPQEHLAGVEKLLDDAKSNERNRRSIFRELADYIGKEVADQGNAASYHRADGDIEFLKAVSASALKIDPGILALLAAGSKEGVFMLIGPEGAVKEAGPKIAEIVEGRGGGKAGRFQGKASALNRFSEAVALLKEIAQEL